MEYSASLMVWWSRPSACSTDDLPDALKPVSSVNGASGNRRSSKHLNERNSILVST